MYRGLAEKASSAMLLFQKQNSENRSQQRASCTRSRLLLWKDSTFSKLYRYMYFEHNGGLQARFIFSFLVHEVCLSAFAGSKFLMVLGFGIANNHEWECSQSSIR